MSAARDRRLKRADAHHERLRNRSAPTLQEFDDEYTDTIEELMDYSISEGLTVRPRWFHEPNKRPVIRRARNGRFERAIDMTEDESWYADYLDEQNRIDQEMYDIEMYDSDYDDGYYDYDDESDPYVIEYEAARRNPVSGILYEDWYD